MSVLIEVRTWHDKTQGQHYYATHVSINGTFVYSQGIGHGSETGAKIEALQRLIDHELIPATCYNTQNIREAGLDVSITVSAGRKRDLFETKSHEDRVRTTEMSN